MIFWEKYVQFSNYNRKSSRGNFSFCFDFLKDNAMLHNINNGFLICFNVRPRRKRQTKFFKNLKILKSFKLKVSI